MSIIARVFVVLNFILSIIFLTFAMVVWTARTKWQKMYELERTANIEIKKAAQDKELDLARAVATRDVVLMSRRQDIVSKLAQINDLRDRISELMTQVGIAKAEAEMARALNDQLMSKLARSDEQRDKANHVIIKQQQALEVARANETKARNERAEMENELNALRQTYAQVLRDKKGVEEDLSVQTQRIQTALKNGVPAEMIIGTDPEATQAPLPPARVVAVKPELDLIMLSIGSNNGAKPGYRMTVSRGDQYLSKCEILRVYPDMCSAKLLLKKGEVQINDEATSRVPGVR